MPITLENSARVYSATAMPRAAATATATARSISAIENSAGNELNRLATPCPVYTVYSVRSDGASVRDAGKQEEVMHSRVTVALLWLFGDLAAAVGRSMGCFFLLIWCRNVILWRKAEIMTLGGGNVIDLLQCV